MDIKSRIDDGDYDDDDDDDDEHRRCTMVIVSVLRNDAGWIVKVEGVGVGMFELNRRGNIGGWK